MRKFALLALFALMLAVVPAFAQNMPGTIADIVIASASGDTPEFATLLTAVQAADPAIVTALANPEASLTVFAPTDAAFAALAAALGEEAFGAVLADQAALSGILLFHVLDGKVMSADVVAGLEASNGLLQVPTLQGQFIDITTEMGSVFVNGAKLNLEMVDIEASNGVIHVIDAVILPESRTLAEIVVESAGAETPEFATLLTAVQAADPAVLEALSSAESNLTVFAPTDAAFAALAEALGAEAFGAVLADPAALTNILLYHVIADRVGSDAIGKVIALDEGLLAEDMRPEWLGEVAEDGSSFAVTMANGAVATIAATEMGVSIAGANIVVTNIDAANGIIHVIDAVMLPPSE
jgi:uncharacterized surface protein with fasciclin (FAS1) repeats